MKLTFIICDFSEKNSHYSLIQNKYSWYLIEDKKWKENLKLYRNTLLKRLWIILKCII